ncbi:triple helix repeat-containing collagen [Streptomyces malaysiensis subsp. malaysiensis]|nr:triple helix repeat-containing collagen [Streptomyces malaysiensis]
MRWATPEATVTEPASTSGRAGRGGAVAGADARGLVAGGGGAVAPGATERWAVGVAGRCAAGAAPVAATPGLAADGPSAADHRSGTTGGSGAEPPGVGGTSCTPENSGTDRCATSGTTGPAAGAGSAPIGVPVAVDRCSGTGMAAEAGAAVGPGAAAVSTVRTTSGSSGSSGLDGASPRGGSGGAAPGSSGVRAPVLAAGLRWAVGGNSLSGSPSPKAADRWTGGEGGEGDVAGGVSLASVRARGAVRGSAVS